MLEDFGIVLRFTITRESRVKVSEMTKTLILCRKSDIHNMSNARSRPQHPTGNTILIGILKRSLCNAGHMLFLYDSAKIRVSIGPHYPLQGCPSVETAKTEALCHCKRNKIKIPLCSKARAPIVSSWYKWNNLGGTYNNI